MSRRAYLAFGLLLPWVAIACFANLDGFATGVPQGDAGLDGTAPAVEASAGDAGSVLADASEAGCSGTAGPAMIRLGRYCIDMTEVTAAQYNAFVLSTPSLASLPPACAFKTTFDPSDVLPSDTRPARFVDWCDAYAYCAWAGKRLCASIAGGPASRTNRGALTDEWYSACSNAGRLAYPYGQTYDPTRCNGADENGGAGEPVAVGSLPDCVGPEPGVFDLSGNVREWQDACDPSLDAGNETCTTRGGAADDPEGSLGCATHSVDPRSYASKHLGFRCCGD